MFDIIFTVLIVIIMIMFTLGSVISKKRKESSDSLELEDLKFKNKTLRELNERLFEELKYRGNLIKESKIHETLFSNDELTFILKKVHPDVNSNSEISNEVSKKINRLRRQ